MRLPKTGNIRLDKTSKHHAMTLPRSSSDGWWSYDSTIRTSTNQIRAEAGQPKLRPRLRHGDHELTCECTTRLGRLDLSWGEMIRRKIAEPCGSTNVGSFSKSDDPEIRGSASTRTRPNTVPYSGSARMLQTGRGESTKAYRARIEQHRK